MFIVPSFYHSSCGLADSFASLMRDCYDVVPKNMSFEVGGDFEAGRREGKRSTRYEVEIRCNSAAQGGEKREAGTKRGDQIYAAVMLMPPP